MITKEDLLMAMDTASDRDLRRCERRAEGPSSRQVVRVLSVAAVICLVLTAAAIGFLAPKGPVQAPAVLEQPTEPTPVQPEPAEQPQITWNQADYDAPEAEIAYPEGTVPFSYQDLTEEDVTQVLGHVLRDRIGGQQTQAQAVYTASGQLHQVQLGFQTGSHNVTVHLLNWLQPYTPALTEEVTYLSATEFVCWLVGGGTDPETRDTRCHLVARTTLGSVKALVALENVTAAEFDEMETWFAQLLSALGSQGQPELAFLGYVNTRITWNQTAAPPPLEASGVSEEAAHRSRYLTEEELEALLPEAAGLKRYWGQARYTLEGLLYRLTLQCGASNTEHLDHLILPPVSVHLTGVDLEQQYPPAGREPSRLEGRDVLLWRGEAPAQDHVQHSLFASAQMNGQTVYFEAAGPLVADDQEGLDLLSSHFLSVVATFLREGSNDYSAVAAQSDTALVFSAAQDREDLMVDLPAGTKSYTLAWEHQANLLPSGFLLNLMDRAPDCITGLGNGTFIFDKSDTLIAARQELKAEGCAQPIYLCYGSYFGPDSQPAEEVTFSLGGTEVYCWTKPVGSADSQQANLTHCYGALKGKNQYVVMENAVLAEDSPAQEAFARVLAAYAKSAPMRDYGGIYPKDLEQAAPVSAPIHWNQAADETEVVTNLVPTDQYPLTCHPMMDAQMDALVPDEIEDLIADHIGDPYLPQSATDAKGYLYWIHSSFGEVGGVMLSINMADDRSFVPKLLTEQVTTIEGVDFLCWKQDPVPDDPGCRMSAAGVLGVVPIQVYLSTSDDENFAEYEALFAQILAAYAKQGTPDLSSFPGLLRWE